MHILYLHQFFTTPSGTSGTRSYTFAREWVRMGHRVTMVTGAVDGVPPTSPREESTVDGIDVIQLGVEYQQELSIEERKQAFLDFAKAASREVLRLDRPDVIYASSTPLTIAIPALAARLRWRAPLVFEVRDLWPDAPIAFGALSPSQIRIARALEHTVYAASEAVVALSPGMLEAVLERGANPQRSLMVPNGVDRALYEDAPSRRAARAQFGLDQAEFLAVYVGALGPVHGIAHTLEAVRLAAEQGAPVRFVLVGEGTMEDDVRQAAREHPGHLTYLGPIPRSRVPAALAAADVTLTTVSDEPILRTTCSNKLFDAMGAGRPQVVNLPGWNTELVTGRGIGYAAAPGSGRAILDAVLAARSDEERAAKGQQSARVGVEFERERFAERLEGLLSELVQGRPRMRDALLRGARGLAG